MSGDHQADEAWAGSGYTTAGVIAPAPDLGTAWRLLDEARAENGRLRELLLKVRAALQDNPTAFGARREALEAVNAFDLDDLVDPQ